MACADFWLLCLIYGAFRSRVAGNLCSAGSPRLGVFRFHSHPSFQTRNSVLRTGAESLHHSNSTLTLTGTFTPQMCYFRHIVSKQECLLFCAYVLTGIIWFFPKASRGQFSFICWGSFAAVFQKTCTFMLATLSNATRPNCDPDVPVEHFLLYFSYILVGSLVTVAIMHVWIPTVWFRKWINAAVVPGGRTGFHLDLPHFNAKLWRGLILPLK